MISVDADTELFLKELKDFHARDLFDLIEDNRKRLREFLPWLDTNQNLSDTERFIHLTKDFNRRGLSLNLGIFRQDRLLGIVGLNRIDRDNRSAQIGYWIAEEFSGRGLMTRSVEALVQYSFQELGLHRLEIRVAPENIRSRKIAERLGFEQEGQLRDAEWLYDHFVDHLVFAKIWTTERH